MVIVYHDDDSILYKTGVPSKFLRKLKRRGDTKQCRCCNTKVNLTTHHIIPVSVDASLANIDDNMIVLCKKCHESYGHCGDAGRYYNPRVLEDIRKKDEWLAFSHRVTIPNSSFACSL